MTSRERIIETLNHREPDKLAIDFGGFRSTGISTIAYKNLKEYLGIHDGAIKLYDIYQQLAEPEPGVLERMGGDVVQLHRYAPSFDIPINSWKLGTLSDGSECLVPGGYNPIRNEKGDLDIIVNNRAIARMPKSGLYFDMIYFPYADAEGFNDIDTIPIKEITDEELSHLGKEAKRLHDTTDKAILAQFGGSVFESGQVSWGYEKFFTEMALNPELIHYWCDKTVNAYMRDLEKYMNAVGDYIQIIQFGDDLGTQEAPQISVNMYRQIIKPYHMKMYSFIRNNYPKVKVFLHSCGAIFNLIPDLIDAGVQVLNPVQISAKGMNPVDLKKTFGSSLSFWGGGADMQLSVQTKSIEEIRTDVQELIKVFAPGGGFVFTQIHNIQADVPPKKIMAIYDTALDMRDSIYR
jgi:uroporphyrinogen decarboxylase